MTPTDPPARSKAVIAIFNASADTVGMLRTALEQQGFQTVGGHIPEVKRGELDFIEFVQHHRPAKLALPK